MKKILSVFILVLTLAFTTQAFASLTFSTNAITGTTASSIDLGAGNTLSLQTTGNGAINLGSGLLTSTGSATFSGIVQAGSLQVERINMGAVSHDVTIGASALISNTTGNENTAIGFETLKLNQGGWTNVAIGAGTLSMNVSGNYNVAMGGSLTRNVSGNDNTAIGTWSLYMATASDNVAVGSNAGYSSGAVVVEGTNAITTGSKLTFIGTRSGLGSATQRTNSTAIGSEAYVDADNTVVLGDENVVNVMAASDGAAKVTAGTLRLSGLATYADNTAALAGGLVAGDVYRTGTGVLMVTY